MARLYNCLIKSTQVKNALLAGVILVGACPGGTASNVITYLSGGDVALSVGMTSVNTVLAPCLYPGNNLPVPA
jgi:BASS family bile acid:Na+ symporter